MILKRFYEMNIDPYSEEIWPEKNKNSDFLFYVIHRNVIMGAKPVFMVKRNFWERYHSFDGLTRRNVPRDVLEECGVNTIELTASLFSIREGENSREVVDKLLDAGFIEGDDDFKRFCRNSGLI